MGFCLKTDDDSAVKTARIEKSLEASFPRVLRDYRSRRACGSRGLGFDQCLSVGD